MRIYTVHLRRQGLDPDRDVVFVEEGFSWPAFLFTALWALWCRLWWVALALVAGEAALNALLVMLGPDPLSHAGIMVGFAAIVGMVGNDLKRWTLRRQGFDHAAVIAAATLDDAQRRFYDHNPDLAMGCMP